MEDEDIIARASSGLALCGTHVGISDGGRRALKQLLRRPTNCKLIGPQQMFKIESFSFSSMDASQRFCQAVEKSGWSFAVSASSPLSCLLPGNISLDVAKDKGKERKMFLEEWSTEACQIQCSYYPKASFNIPRDQMQLNDEAIDDARRVKTLVDATEFLRNYNSHVSTGTYHVGGTLLKGITIQADSTQRLETMLDTAARNFNGGVQFGYMGFQAGGKVVNVHEVTSSSAESSRSQQARLGTIVMALGPQTADEKLFETGLNDSSNWYIIDSTEEAPLVPVWEIAPFGDAEELEECRCMLLDAWQRAVADEAPRNARLYDLLQSSTITRPTILNSRPAGKSEAIAILISRLAIKEPRFQDLATPLLSPQTAKEILLKVWIEASGGDTSNRISGLDPKVLLFELPDFQKLLLHIAQSTEREMDEGKSLVRRIISNDVEVSLVRAGVSLQEPVKAVLQANVVEDEVQDVATKLPMQRYEPAQLPVHVENLVANVYPTSAKLTTDDASLGSSLVSVKAWLRQDTNGVVRKIIMKYGFDENGDCNVEGVTNEQVKNMTQEVTVALEGDQFKFPSTPPKGICTILKSNFDA
jgi:hypothetical protein